MLTNRWDQLAANTTRGPGRCPGWFPFARLLRRLTQFPSRGFVSSSRMPLTLVVWAMPLASSFTFLERLKYCSIMEARGVSKLHLFQRAADRRRWSNVVAERAL